MSKHTKEPWNVAFFPFAEEMDIVSDGQCVASTIGKHNKDNARRIVACVNACEGMDDPEKEIDGYKKIMVDALRDKLTYLKALKSIQEFSGNSMTSMKIDKLIAKVEGKK